MFHLQTHWGAGLQHRNVWGRGQGDANSPQQHLPSGEICKSARSPLHPVMDLASPIVGHSHAACPPPPRGTLSRTQCSLRNVSPKPAHEAQTQVRHSVKGRTWTSKNDASHENRKKVKECNDDASHTGLMSARGPPGHAGKVFRTYRGWSWTSEHLRPLDSTGP